MFKTGQDWYSFGAVINVQILSNWLCDNWWEMENVQDEKDDIDDRY